MQIVKSSKNDREEAMRIAAELGDWFNKAGLKNMRIDFEMNNVIVAKEGGKVEMALQDMFWRASFLKKP